MDRSLLVQTLVMSEKTHSIVTIKVVNEEKPIVGAVQKVLNQMIILKSHTAQPITLTFGDIESVDRSTNPVFSSFVQKIRNRLQHYLRLH